MINLNFFHVFIFIYFYPGFFTSSFSRHYSIFGGILFRQFFATILFWIFFPIFEFKWKCKKCVTSEFFCFHFPVFSSLLSFLQFLDTTQILDFLYFWYFSSLLEIFAHLSFFSFLHPQPLQAFTNLHKMLTIRLKMNKKKYLQKHTYFSPKIDEINVKEQFSIFSQHFGPTQNRMHFKKWYVGTKTTSERK